MIHKIFRTFFILIGTIIFASSLAFPQDPPKTARSSKDDYAELFVRIEKSEIESRDPKRPEWAGRYTWGHIGFDGVNLYITPEMGFVYRPYVDYEPNNIEGQYDFGEVEIRERGAIYLKPKRGNLEEDEYYLIKWGERRFLLSKTKIAAFSNAVNAGCEEFAQGEYPPLMTLRFPTHSDDLRKGFFGIPEFPAQFRKLILRKPLTVSISAVGETKTSKFDSDGLYPNRLRQRTQITINAGENNGLFVGMQLFPINYTERYPDIFITSVSAKSATGEASTVFEGEAPPRLTVGAKLTSKIDAEQFGRSTAPYICK